MRLWTPDTGKFSQTAKLTAKWPTQPAAVYLYSANATTVLLALDFDTSRGDAAAVERDLRTAENWLIRCGARVVTDYTDDGVPTFSYVRDRIEGRAATAAAAQELAGGDARAAEAEDAFAERERKAADRLAEIRRSIER